ncbi:hypothetical protein ACIHEI_29795 [Kitasatospora sp. NPDC051984]|uniref:hypothetical protein n=1 Tax=Kitasatospora sp. NPDC051984 TaxID=3364059 RepID=UPI0037CB71E1
MKTPPKVERAGPKRAAALQVGLEEAAGQVDTSTGEITAPKAATLAADADQPVLHGAAVLANAPITADGDRAADYGAFTGAARGQVDLERIERN